MTVLLYAPKHQQMELTLRHEKEKERELSRKFQLQKEQYESTIQRQLTFIDQVGKHGLWSELLQCSGLSECSDLCRACSCSSSMIKRL